MRSQIPDTVTCSFFLRPVTKIETMNIIASLKNNKAPGVDGIQAETLKEVAAEICEPLTYILNLILQSGECPELFKISIIRPIFKKGDRTDANNYRPISLISNLAKIFEKSLKIRIQNFIEKFKIISPNQYGFQKNKSTEDAIANVTQKIYKTLDDGKVSLGIFLDLMKAFDTVSHEQLLQTLYNLGFRGISHSLFESYLENRVQQVEIEGTRSIPRIVQYGVPQGTVIGPILFIIYLNSLLTLNCKGDIVSFADDTIIYYEAENWQELRQKAESDMGNVLDCLSHKLLTINLTKSVFLTFSCNKTKQPSFNTLKVRTNTGIFEFTRTQQVKYLGIIIDCHMKWSEHICYIVKNLRPVLYKIKYLRRFLDFKELMILYYSLVESRLRYGILGWGGLAECHLKACETLQKYFLKLILWKNVRYPSDDLYRATQVNDMRQLFFKHIAIYSYKNKHIFNQIDHAYHTRIKNKEQVRTIFSYKTIGQRNFFFLAGRIYNMLPDDIKQSQTKQIFKKRLKNYLYNVDRQSIRNVIA